MKNIEVFFDREERKILSAADNLHRSLAHLRYEGKVHRGRNVSTAYKAVAHLVKTLRNHRKLQEEVIFPFLVVHIPKYESVIRFLRADHQDIRKSKERLQLSLRKLSKHSDHGLEDGKVQELGTYLTCFLRHHTELEKENIHKAVEKELRKEEKKEVAERIQKWVSRHPAFV